MQTADTIIYININYLKYIFLIIIPTNKDTIFFFNAYYENYLMHQCHILNWIFSCFLGLHISIFTIYNIFILKVIIILKYLILN